MLEIASQITLCLLVAALIGFMIGYLTAKKNTQTTLTNAPSTETAEEEVTETVTETKNPEVTETENPEEKDAVIETETGSSEIEELEIPTDQAVENALAALKELEDEEVTAEEEVIMEEPELLSAPRDDQKDDLTKIKGIGPKVEEKLNEAGIYHFYQIANWKDENIRWLEKHTTFAHRATKDLWVLQAKSFNK